VAGLSCFQSSVRIHFLIWRDGRSRDVHPLSLPGTLGRTGDIAYYRGRSEAKMRCHERTHSAGTSTLAPESCNGDCVPWFTPLPARVLARDAIGSLKIHVQCEPGLHFDPGSPTLYARIASARELFSRFGRKGHNQSIYSGSIKRQVHQGTCPSICEPI
jgi:hypothetical protein